MRIETIKYLCIGPSSLKNKFFGEVQKLGIVEFIDPKKTTFEKSPEVEIFMEALHFLRKRGPKKEYQEEGDYRSAIVLAREIVEKNERIERLQEEKRVLLKEMGRVAPFGDFSIEELRKIENETGRIFQFFFARKSHENDPSMDQNLFFVGTKYGLNYYLSINKEKVAYEGLIEMFIERPYGDLETDLAEINRKIDALEGDLDHLAHHQKLIRMGLIHELNRTNLIQSKEKTEGVLEGNLFSVEGWLPKNKVQALEKLGDELGVMVSPVAMEPEDKQPTYLENRGLARLGEDLINIYDIPSAQDRDPSLWVYFAFGLFFSMIIGDAGYGLVLLAISLFLYFKFGKKPGLGRRVILLSSTLSIGCIIWGILAASFFGLTVPPDSKWRSLSLIDWMVDKKAEYLIQTQDANYQLLIKKHPELQEIKEPRKFVMGVNKKDEKGVVSYPIYDEFADNVLMEIVLFIGACHIFLSLLRYVDKNWAAIGWMIFIVGAYLNFPSILKATSLIYYLFHVPPKGGAELGLYMIFIGIGLATLLALIQKKWAGLEEPTKVIGIFADIMSYLRIYALALAGVIMAGTFNKMGMGMPLYIGVIVIFFGHTVNFLLALMGGLIHGLRLNFIEWYHYSFEGGGKNFNPLTLHKLE